METRRRADLFDGIKQALRARGMTYADLAARLDLSEPTIKRLFADKDCKVGRLLDMCDVLGITLMDVLDQAERADDGAALLPLHVEAELAANPDLFHAYVLLHDGLPPEALMAQFGRGRAWFDQVHLRLERLGLASTGLDGRFLIDSDHPIKFRRQGPLHRLIRAINERFVGTVFEMPEGPDRTFRTASRRMLPQTAEVVQEELADLHRRMRMLARQDRLLARSDDLRSYKLTAAFGPVNFPELLEAETENAAPEGTAQ